MKYQLLAISICIVLLSGCISKKDVYEYEDVKQSQAEMSVEKDNPAPDEITTLLATDNGIGEIDAKPGAVKSAIDGRWVGQYDAGDPSTIVEYRFKADGNTLTGTSGSGVDGALPVTIKSGKIDGSKFHSQLMWKWARIQ